MHLIAPMADEPPSDYVAFVARHASGLRTEAHRLAGGAPVHEEIYLAVLTDLAGHWRRLRLLHRTDTYMRQRLTARTAHWREDQVYEVEVRVLPPPPPPARPRAGSLALRKATIIPGTARASLDALADAEIAWIHAHLRAQRHRVLRHALFVLLVVGALIQYMAWLSADPL
ncbi:hypothetical protein [Actinoplanes derwentensis]|uniref:Uncharacterized protein n=1 Tax=Actinoplanes derwentensis TaxID=113562 RepID=A0A1H2D9V4_9ACTN|nr:hypothetical protein [Actinoplanes derwentensis]GID81637.1 hypothetical protein Ade03nite_05610 [Actinoplanes derwentensis]SDT79491.1 hypothetical protein SAMN04489716_8808 [Actinoplanes derwentensis]